MKLVMPPRRRAHGIGRITRYSDAVIGALAVILISQTELLGHPAMILAAGPQQELLSLMPTTLSYATNAGVLGLFWTAHHSIFKLVRRTDNALLLLNVVFLVCVGFVALPITLIDRYGAQPLTVALFTSILALAGLALNLLWWYAAYQRRLFSAQATPALIGYTTRTLLILPVGFALGGALLLLDIHLAEKSWLLVGLIWLLAEALHRRTQTPHPPAGTLAPSRVAPWARGRRMKTRISYSRTHYTRRSKLQFD